MTHPYITAQFFGDGSIAVFEGHPSDMGHSHAYKCLKDFDEFIYHLQQLMNEIYGEAFPNEVKQRIDKMKPISKGTMLVDCPKAPQPVACTPQFPVWAMDTLQSKSGQKKETPMNATSYLTLNEKPSDIQLQRSYLLDRLEQTYYDQKDLRKAFNMDDDPRPETAEELIKRMEDKQYLVVDARVRYDEYDEEFDLGEAGRFLRWRNPEAKRDEKGYEAAVERKRQAKVPTRDTIMISDPAEGLKALQAYQTTDFSKAN